MSAPKWGVVATIKAPTEDVLRFVAYHLDLGADDVTVFLDDRNEKTAKALSKNPKAHAVLTDDEHWQSTIGRRPKKHQVRQVRNASYYYRRAKDLDWVVHIDVDEFLCPERPVAEILAACAAHVPVLRVFPSEALCTDGLTEIDPEVTYCKSRLPNGPQGKAIEHKLYPTYGGILKSGFVSHVEGKIFVRTGLNDIKFGIHRAFENKEIALKAEDAEGIELCHKHIESWEKWLTIMDFRLSRGSYRQELEQNIDPLSGRVQRHALFKSLTDGGTESLRAFFEESCLATPELRTRLDELGYLRQYKLDLAQKRAKHFPK
ncbi:glycosyltransferase family 2 protein [Cognatishimia activa]|uniref:Glycosyl transferase family 2 n=1 Tax=Cognatishimia activa TaxID=1715691 RepID=A0A0P1IPA3_9RHOB|nr:glycosyltransferase family 2 protein [Cognatishimia activa]CUJ22304.1 hypothetical protein TA5113_02702 [Cognatishimia activa]CUK25431.1 hypothetical protein TA5114_01230 [Cognatishimia activa]